ncbi:MAG: helix-turn-helix transcriptional regulator [Bacilli bacterium]|nr:helix-turn-helix transcriptional regulator [Bacilli bacterium]
MDNLIKIRKKHNYTCTYMAEQLKISKPFYWQIENKKRRLSYDMAVKIACIFNLKPDDIFYKDFKKQN